MRLLVEAGPRQLREPGGIMWIGFVRFHSLQTLVRLAGIDAYNRHAQFAKTKADRG